MTEPAGQALLGIGLAMLSVSAPVCMVLLKGILAAPSKSNGKDSMPRLECEAWRQGYRQELTALSRGQAELFNKMDDIHKELMKGKR